jgi:ABC-2 type transport system permease protein
MRADTRESVNRQFWTVYLMLRRELIRFGRGRVRIATSLIQPLLMLFVVGTGLSSAIRQGTDGVDYRTFLFPGIVIMPAVYAAIGTTMTIVWDRELGFLRVILAAPVHRYAIVVGKCLGGTVVATLQASLVLLFAPIVGVAFHPRMVLELLALLAVSAFILTAIGMAVGCRVQKVQTVQVIIPVLAMPIFFLSGAVYPVASLPDWLLTLTRLNPLSYAVDLMRHSVMKVLPEGEAAAMRAMTGDISPVGALTAGVELLLLVVVGAVALAVAERGLRRSRGW